MVQTISFAHSRVIFVAASLAGLLLGCAHGTQPVSEANQSRHPADDRAVTLPDQANWQSLYAYADALDLATPGVSLKLSSGGTSVYAVVSVDGKTIGAVIPENSAASVSGETFAFTLARAFGVSEIYQPGIYHQLTGPSLKQFMTIVPSTPLKGTNREENRQAILKRYAKDPNEMDAVFKSWDSKPSDYDALAANGRMNITHVLSGSSVAFSNLISCRGPQPNASTTVTLNGGKNNEREIARELSSILLIDALTQQWDRFSGGNLQTVNKNGQVILVAYDNGGTWGGTKSTERALTLVSRFDSNVATQILGMDDFFRSGQPYLGLRTEADFLTAFDIVKAPKAFEKFKQSLEIVADHVRKNQSCTF